MIVAFVPVLHSTVRRIAKQQSHLRRADITHNCGAYCCARFSLLLCKAIRQGGVHGMGIRLVRILNMLANLTSVLWQVVLSHARPVKSH
jgi:hypothetical protein